MLSGSRTSSTASSATDSAPLARLLIVGCGCRGRALGSRLAGKGWLVRGTSRSPDGVAAIQAAGLDGVEADPERVATVLEHLDGVAVVCWLFGSAAGGAEALHGSRLERLLEELVDTPVRGFVYEARGTVAPEVLAAGRATVEAATARWRIPAAFVDADPADPDAWSDAAMAAVRRSLGA